MKQIPTDRVVWTSGPTRDGHVYHVWKNNKGEVVVQVGCHRSRLNKSEARILAGFLEAASTNQENHAHHH